jgi:hypothetical protein
LLAKSLNLQTSEIETIRKESNASPASQQKEPVPPSAQESAPEATENPAYEKIDRERNLDTIAKLLEINPAKKDLVLKGLQQNKKS